MMDREFQEAPGAARGRIVLSCGCEYRKSMGDLDLLHVRYRTETCDPVDGFVKAVGYALYCPSCKEAIAGELILSDEEERAWLA